MMRTDLSDWFQIFDLGFTFKEDLSWCEKYARDWHLYELKSFDFDIDIYDPWQIREVRHDMGWDNFR